MVKWRIQCAGKLVGQIIPHGQEKNHLTNVEPLQNIDLYFNSRFRINAQGGVAIQMHANLYIFVYSGFCRNDQRVKSGILKRILTAFLKSQIRPYHTLIR